MPRSCDANDISDWFQRALESLKGVVSVDSDLCCCWRVWSARLFRFLFVPVRRAFCLFQLGRSNTCVFSRSTVLGCGRPFRVRAAEDPPPKPGQIDDGRMGALALLAAKLGT